MELLWEIRDVTTSNKSSSAKENTEEDVEEEFRRDSVFIKVSTEDIFKSSFLKIPGCVPINVRACFKRLYPRSEVEKESSFKFYLKLCGLESKADMPFNRLWNYYSEAKKGSSDITVRNMHEVANYCIIDALRYQELIVKRNVINDYREVASIAYVSLFDTHYRANGMKVRNLLGAYATKRNMLVSTICHKDKEKGKYPGAYVFPPIKGIENKRPVTGLDFVSLYFSLIMAYNLSPEKLILRREEAVNVHEKGNELYEIKFPFNGRILNAWSVRHDNCSEKKGLYPTKKRLEKLISTIEGKGKIVPNASKSKYDSLCFDYNCLNSKQFALKVYMNTFYGEAGNSNSPFFLRELAGGITSAGQYNIDLVAKFVTAKGFGIKYGDTDSLYLTYPDKYYKKCDRDYNENKLSKEVYWSEMVKITMKVMDEFRNKVNAYLRIKNGTTYLKMAYEEVLFPVCFTGKKKYFGIGHEEIKIMWKAMDLNNTRSIHKIVEDTFREASLKQWEFDQFIAMATWKPNKDNKCIQRFMGRIKEKYENKIPDPGERFSYVVMKGERYHDKNEKTVGLCARFINDNDRYQPPASHKIMQFKDSDEREKQIDHGHNGKGGSQIHIGWLLACTVAQAKKVLINPPEDSLSKKVLAHIEKRFEEVPLAPVLIR
ncbi:DNA/RNA polymerase [Rhizophagus irregularis]|uniref:DNA polymerase n=1 Tax=Rhizophagus irregularis TaxID=588596 RepID=A0A2N1MB16_9GLOM|nr:DNA/RNA polymerase [Rhizophagus irregularis]